MEIDIAYEKKYTTILKEIILNKAESENCGIFLYGSRASGKERFASDFDIGFINIQKSHFEKLRSEILDEVEESIIPWHTDIVNFDSVSSSFKETAMKKIQWWKQITIEKGQL